MKIYHFGAEDAPVLLLLPGTCCHWKSNFGAVIPLLADSFRVLCVSYDGFDETEQTEFPTVLEETEKIEAYLKTHCGGRIRAAYGCSLGGSFVGLLAARQIFVSGFLLKPANEADVRNVLEHLRYPPENAPVGIKIQCFGNFEIFVGGRALAFKRSKSKELLAYLVDRNGATCTNGEMLAVLWEDKPDTASLHSHLRNLIFDLSHTLEDAGVTGLLIRGRSTLALDTSKVDCDYYNFLRGSRSATNSYRGEYMTQYSWAEVTRSALRQQANVQKTASIPSYYVPPTGF